MEYTVFLLALLAYLLGSVPTGKLLGLYYGIDVQRKGSGNIGFANSYRVLGKKPAFIVLAVDIGKGFLPVFLSMQAGLPQEQSIIIGLLAVIGHIFPVWLGFQGGKGVATGLGVALAIAPNVVLPVLIVFGIILGTTRLFALASVAGTWIAVLRSFWLLGITPVSIGLLCIAGLITLRHSGNFYRMLHNTEPKV